MICHHRESLFREMGQDESLIEAMREPFRQWLETKLADSSYFGFVFEDHGTVVAGVGLLELDWAPHVLHPSMDRRGYVLNVYVEPTHRRRGLAQQLMRRSEEEFRTRGLQYAALHASEAGRPIYEGLGWSPTSEMGKAL